MNDAFCLAVGAGSRAACRNSPVRRQARHLRKRHVRYQEPLSVGTPVAHTPRLRKLRDAAAGVLVDAGMHLVLAGFGRRLVFPTDAVAGPLEKCEFLDAHVQQLASLPLLVALGQRSRFEGVESVKSRLAQHPADGSKVNSYGSRNLGPVDLLRGVCPQTPVAASSARL